MIAEKQTIILTNYSRLIGSRSKQSATNDIQKGFVCQITMMRARGAIGAAIFKSKKLAYPVRQRTSKVRDCSRGNILTGL